VVRLAAVPPAALMLGVFLELLLGRVLSPRAKGWLAFGSGLIALAGALALLPTIAAGGAVDGTLLPRSSRGTRGCHSAITWTD
jgi:hypothetical protein